MTNSTTVHINQPKSYLGRAIRKCTTCHCRHRFLVRFFEWYGAQWYCGGCGYVWDEGRRSCGKRERAKNRQFVRDYWVKSKSMNLAINDLMEDISIQQEPR